MATYDFQLDERALRVQLDLPADLRQQFAKAQRSYSYTGALPAGWKLSYYTMFLKHSADQPVLRSLWMALRQTTPAPDVELSARLATAFVQSGVAYDWQTAYRISGSHIRYPSETLADGKGVCADKTVLLAALLQDLGYGLAVLTWDRANHMALGIRVPSGYGNFGLPYAMIETTSPTAIGQVPDQYAGGIRLDGKPEVVELPGGQAIFTGIVEQRRREADLQKQYGADYLKMPPPQQVIYRQMALLQADIHTLSQQMQGCSGTLPPARYAECRALQSKHNAKVADYNALVAKFNAAGKK